MILILLVPVADVPNYVLTALAGLNTFLLGAVLFFLKGWYDNVNDHIKESEKPIQEFNAMKEVMEHFKDDMKEVKDDIKNIRQEITIYIREHK